MLDLNPVKGLVDVNLKLTKISGKGGDGGEIIMISEKFSGYGVISTDGGKGIVGGKGGKIHIQTKKNSFKGSISSKGG